MAEDDRKVAEPSTREEGEIAQQVRQCLGGHVHSVYRWGLLKRSQLSDLVEGSMQLRIASLADSIFSSGLVLCSFSYQYTPHQQFHIRVAISCVLCFRSGTGNLIFPRSTSWRISGHCGLTTPKAVRNRAPGDRHCGQSTHLAQWKTSGGESYPPPRQLDTGFRSCTSMRKTWKSVPA